jgi:hypothetical protein
MMTPRRPADPGLGRTVKPDNSPRPLITGWRLWLRCTLLGEGTGVTYRDPAFPACPECGSPNVRLLLGRRNWRLWLRRERRHASAGLNYFRCLERDCKGRGVCVVPLASTGIERRRAVIRARIYLAVFVAALLALVLTGHGSWLGSAGS